MAEPTNERPLMDLSLDESGAYIDEIDAMSLQELEARLPEAQEALEAIEAKLEELIGLRDAALVCAAGYGSTTRRLKAGRWSTEAGELAQVPSDGRGNPSFPAFDLERVCGKGQVDALGAVQNYADLWYLTNMGIGSPNITVFGPGSVPTFVRLRGY